MKGLHNNDYRIEEGPEEEDEEVDESPEEVGDGGQAQRPRIEDSTVRGHVNHLEDLKNPQILKEKKNSIGADTFKFSFIIFLDYYTIDGSTNFIV